MVANPNCRLLRLLRDCCVAHPHLALRAHRPWGTSNLGHPAFGTPRPWDTSPMKPLTRILLYGSIALILGFIALFIE